MARTIAVTGKGGVGKTTVSALMIRCLAESARDRFTERLRPPKRGDDD